MTGTNTEPIAIVGYGCRFPGGVTNPSRLWELLRDPVDVGSRIPSDRFNVDQFYHPDGAHHGTTNVTNAYFIQEDIRHFDAQFFGISPGEADAIDPQQRVLLETVFEAMEMAGQTIEGLKGSDTAVYVGLMCTDYMIVQSQDLDFSHTYGATGLASSNASSRISYFFDWHGPSMTIDTACSSSLVSIYNAVQALRTGVSKVAVAAGRSRMWDQNADGYARGEGVAAVCLKTLSQALRDGDNIDCVIREIGVNHDGKTAGLTLPSAIAQMKLIRETYRKAGLDPDRQQDHPQYFEAHGTGTPAGDPQEAQAIYDAFCRGAKAEAVSAETMYVGSVKTVVGHTEGAAGVCGIIKACLALKHGIIPPNLHFTELNTSIRPFYGRLKIPTSALPWPRLQNANPRRASVNSFGFGGTNAHAILESFHTQVAVADTITPPVLLTPFVFSASSAKSLHALIKAYLRYLRGAEKVDLESLAHTLGCRRSAQPLGLAVAAASSKELIESLDQHIELSKETPIGRRSAKSSPDILAVFTGQGAQWPRMGARLVQYSPIAQETIKELEESLASLPESDRPVWRIGHEIQKEAESSCVREAAYAQTLCTAIQLVLLRLLQESDIRLQSVVGHSSGEIAASVAAGYLRPRDAIRIAYYRGLCAQKVAGGSMMAVGTTMEDAEELCRTDDFEGRLCVAACNSSSSVTISGDRDAIDEAKLVFDEEKKFARLLKVDTAYHSHHMQLCADNYRALLQNCNIEVLNPPSEAPKWFSSVLAGVEMTRQHLSPSEYWIGNLVNPVLFSQAIKAACGDNSYNLGLEIGPHPALAGPVKQSFTELGNADCPYVGVLERNGDDLKAFSHAIGEIWTVCGPSAVSVFNNQRTLCASKPLRVLQGLPTYPWHHDRVYWNESRSTKLHLTQNGSIHPLLGRLEPNGTEIHMRWKNILRPKEIPWLSGHKLQGQIVFPATGYISLAVEAVMQVLNDFSVQSMDIVDLSIKKAVVINELSGTEVSFTMNIRDVPQKDLFVADFSCYSSNSRDSGKMQINATGTIEVQTDQAPSSTLPPMSRSTEKYVDIDIEHFYKTVTELGYGYEGPFRGLAWLQRRAGMSRGTVMSPKDIPARESLLLHPAMLDAALQGMIAAFCAPGDGTLSSIYAPSSIQRIAIEPKFFKQAISEKYGFSCTVTDVGQDGMEGDIDITLQGDDAKLFQIEGLRFIPLSKLTEVDDKILFSESVWSVDSANGDLVLAGQRAPPEDHAKAMDCERVALFYLRTLDGMFNSPHSTQKDLEWHHKALLDYAAMICQHVSDSSHPYIKKEWMTDSCDQISCILNSYGDDDVDFAMLKSVGETLPDVILGKTTVFEHMTKNGLLAKYYRDGLGLSFGNHNLSLLAEQIAFRYPHMNILEVGAGTGGATSEILHRLGTAFTSYTYTDISSAYFDAAKAKFAHFSDRMVFDKLDISSDPLKQGYKAGKYDMVIASYVLHATKSLEQTLKNVRTLLRPGGFLVLCEIVDNRSTRTHLAMGGLPGWWIGRDDGRVHGPNVPLEVWDSLFRKTGFSGVDTNIPMVDPLPYPSTAFVTQALDADIRLLRSPLSNNSDDLLIEDFILLGGGVSHTSDMADEIKRLISPRCKSFTYAPDLHSLTEIDIRPGASVLSIADVGGAVFSDMSQSKFEALQKLFLGARNVLWVTQGYQRENPFAAITVGMCRSVQVENFQTRVQLVDFESGESISCIMLVEMILRLRLAHEWQKVGHLKNFLWTTEPELMIKDGLVHALRLKPQKEQNERYNSSKRRIYKEVNLRESAARLRRHNNSYEIAPTYAKKFPVSEDFIKLEVKAALSHSIRMGERSAFFSVATEEKTKHKYLAMSRENASELVVPNSWALRIDVPPAIYGAYLSLVACEVSCKQIARITPSKGTLLVHEPDMFLASSLTRHFDNSEVRILFTTSRAPLEKPHWLYFNPRSPMRLIQASLPEDISCFIDLCQDSGSRYSIAEKISILLPVSCQRYNLNAFLSGHSELSSEADFEDFQLTLRETSETVVATLQSLPDGVPLEMITPQQLTTSTRSSESMFIVDWGRLPVSPVLIESISKRPDLLQGSKTYWLLGLAGDLGQSLADWMVQHGARNVVLSSRSPVVDENWQKSHRLRGVNLEYIACDITSFDDLTRVYATINRTFPPVAGVANGALILRDQSFATMEFDAFDQVCKPKVQGTLHLQKLFKSAELDFFIPFSSAVSVLGNIGQSAYSAANCFMKSIVAQRRHAGLCGSTIDISQVVGAGYIERELKPAGKLGEKILQRISDLVLPMSTNDMHQLFAEAIVAGRPGSLNSLDITTGIRTMQTEPTHPMYWANSTKSSHFIRRGKETLVKMKEDADINRISMKPQIENAETLDDIRQIMRRSLIQRIKTSLQLANDEELHESVPIIDFGLDSLVAVEVRSWFLQETDGIDLPVLKILGGASIADLVEDAMNKLPSSVQEKFGALSGTESIESIKTTDTDITPATPSVSANEE